MHCVRLGLASTTLLLGLAASALAQQTKPIEYKRVVLVGMATHRNGKLCANFAGFMTSGDFFGGLQAKEAPTGRVFTKGETQVTEFPETITVEIQAIMHDCANQIWWPMSPPARESLAKPFMTALNYQLKWKRLLDERPAVYSLSASGPESAFWPETDPPYWTYDLEINSKGVPLTDHLVIEIHSKDQALVAKLAVRL